jgi:hypothetical protein
LHDSRIPERLDLTARPDQSLPPHRSQSTLVAARQQLHQLPPRQGFSSAPPSASLHIPPASGDKAASTQTSLTVSWKQSIRSRIARLLPGTHHHHHAGPEHRAQHNLHNFVASTRRLVAQHGRLGSSHDLSRFAPTSGSPAIARTALSKPWRRTGQQHSTTCGWEVRLQLRRRIGAQRTDKQYRGSPRKGTRWRHG